MGSEMCIRDSFCLRDGVPQCLPATKPVATHKVEIRGDEVYLHPGVPATASATA